MGRHPGVTAALRHFDYDHLSEPLRSVSAAFYTLAHKMVEQIPDDPQLTIGLQKLTEAKDCFVRAARVAHEQANLPQVEVNPPTHESRWRPIDSEGNISPDPAPENPDEPDEGETGPEEMRG